MDSKMEKNVIRNADSFKMGVRVSEQVIGQVREWRPIKTLNIVVIAPLIDRNTREFAHLQGKSPSCSDAFPYHTTTAKETIEKISKTS